MKQKWLLSPIKYSYERELTLWERTRFYVLGVILITFILSLVLITLAHAETYTDTQIVNAIKKAENSKTHPYGVMIKCHNPRQVCFNTVRHARRDWNGIGDFLEFLQKRYAPIGVKNDPNNLNSNWLKNVRYFLGVNHG